MAGVFLGRPLVTFARLPNQDVAIGAADDFFQPGRRASQTRAQVRMLLHGKREVKLPFKPDRRWIHGCTLIESWLPTRCPSERVRCNSRRIQIAAQIRLPEPSSQSVASIHVNDGP